MIVDENEIIDELNEELNSYVNKITQLQENRDELASKVLIAEQINYELSKKQIELSQNLDTEI